MQPACAWEDIPKTYHITSVLPRDKNEGVNIGPMLFCDHDAKEGEELVWVEQKKVLVDGKEYNLQVDPSWRTNWTVFNIDGDYP
jgi:hypothetical protein